MATVYTKRLVATRVSSGGAIPIYTAPAGVTTIIRDIVVYNGQSATQAISIYLTSGSVSPRLFANPALAPATAEHLELRQEILPSEPLTVVTDTGAVTFLITGYQFG